MREELMQSLRIAIAGNEKAVIDTLLYMQTNTLTIEEYEQLHIYIRQAAKISHHAIYIYAMFYDNGYGVIPNKDMAFLLMREAAAKGNAKAMYEVGHRFLFGIGIDKNYINALQWLTIAATSPHYLPEAMHDLGDIYEQGLGVEIDTTTAKNWYEKAIEKGYSGS